jgi:hypothetical protein
MKRSEFAPGRRRPTRAHDASSGRERRRWLPPFRHAMNPRSSPPASVKRTPAANVGGIVSDASSIPRYVEPQMT